MPSKLAPLLADKQPGYIAEEIKREVYATLNELAAGGDGTSEEPAEDSAAEESDDSP
jgi:hypothetical protein